jgi:DNA-binding NtrC family response regulator
VQDGGAPNGPGGYGPDKRGRLGSTVERHEPVRDHRADTHGERVRPPHAGRPALCSDGIVRESDLYLTQAAPKERNSALDGVVGTRGLPLHDFLDQVEREAIQKALEATRFNKTVAAKLLGITFRSLRYRLERLGID